MLEFFARFGDHSYVDYAVDGDRSGTDPVPVDRLAGVFEAFSADVAFPAR
ncbi:MAG TPA: hypothetical protein VGO66_08075 [Solirubrobacterales bacterium]|jgi:hypothetical protein|nr:hypothetical protein [Solirubrobacterales bacterium]